MNFLIQDLVFELNELFPGVPMSLVREGVPPVRHPEEAHTQLSRGQEALQVRGLPQEFQGSHQGQQFFLKLWRIICFYKVEIFFLKDIMQIYSYAFYP